MSNLIILDHVSIAYGHQPLLDNVKFTVNKGERVCLIGRNGAGKSTLLRVIAGNAIPDSGSVWRKPHLAVGVLEQELPHDSPLTVYEFVAQGLAEVGVVLAQYHRLIERTDVDLVELEKLQQQIETHNGWQLQQRIEAVLQRLELNGDDLLTALSGGWQRRAALAKALVAEPELLLLDEPTNHLDVAAIQWLQEELISLGMGLLFITHDRALLKALATRIIELDRGNLTSWPGDYDNFLRRKEEMLYAEEKQNTEFDKKLAAEERWIRQGIKARRTRNEGRVRALKALRVERSQRRELQGKASFNIMEAEKSGQLVIEAKDISYAYQDKAIIKNFSIRIMRGERIGLIGPNGVGKSTLLNVLLGKLTPTSGEVRLGTNLKVAYFDQLRQTLDLEKTVIDNMREVSDTITVNGKQQHLIGYLQDFLFTPQRAMTPVKALSGGECNRLLLARLFAQPANLLVMDEPTNDLDIETLELIEELLSSYQGTLLLVSHDREFLDNVVTSTIAFEGNGILKEYAGGYEDYLRQRAVPFPTPLHANKPVEKKVESIAVPVKTSKKLSYKEQRELAELPKKIADLEAQQAELQLLINNPDFYKHDQTSINQTLDKLTIVESELDKAYLRWEELES